LLSAFARTDVMSVTDEDMRNEMYTDKHGNGQTERDRARQRQTDVWVGLD